MGTPALHRRVRLGARLATLCAALVACGTSGGAGSPAEPPERGGAGGAAGSVATGSAGGTAGGGGADAVFDGGPAGGGGMGGSASAGGSGAAGGPRAMDAGPPRPSIGVTCDGAGAAVNAAPWERLIGWGTVAESGVAAVTGGGAASPVEATTIEQLQLLFAGSTPAVIRVSGTLSGEAVLEGANKTIIGDAGAAIHGLITLKRASNVIVRNLTFVGDNCADKPECKGGTDALSVTFASHHLWIDHCDVSDASDGNLDIKDGSDLITVSFTKFHYTTPGRAHRFSSLIGHSDSDTAAIDDVGNLRVTFHHDWWADNVFERMPRVRFGQVHLFNNLYTSQNNNYCVRAGFEADIRSEHNAFIGVNNPFDLEDPTGRLQSFDDLFKNIKGTTLGAGTAFTPPYAYTMESACTVEATVRASAGPR